MEFHRMQGLRNTAPLIAGMIAAWLCSNASAAPASDSTRYATASLEFQRLVAQATRDSDMPRVKDPKAAEIIATLSDIRLLSSNRYQMKDMGGLMDLCDQSNKAVMSYVMFDVKSVISPQSDPQQTAARLAPLMEKNVRTFQNELGELQPFLFRCLAKEIPLLTEFARSLKPEDFTEVRRSGLKGVRNGMFNVYYGALKASGDRAYSESYRTKVLRTLAELTPQYASILRPEARKQLAELAASSKANVSPSLRDDLQGIVAGMSDPRCEDLCAL
jgi:hypothetical protein